MPFNFLADNFKVKSLGNLALVATAATIFSREQPQRKLRQLIDNQPVYLISDKLDDIIIVGQDEIQHLTMPLLLKKEMKQAIVSLSSEIICWLKHIYKLGFRHNASSIKNLKWTTSGRIDGRETARRLLQTESTLLNAENIFKIATYYCLDEEIKNLASQNLELLKELYVRYHSPEPFPLSFNMEEEIVSLWCRHLLEYEFPNEISVTVLPAHFVKAANKIGNVAAVKFFYHSIKFSSEEDKLEFARQSLKDISLNWMQHFYNVGKFFPLSHRVSCFNFYLEMLNDDNIRKVFAEESAVAFLTVYLLLLFPFRHLFYKYAQIAIDFVKAEYESLNLNSYYVLLQRIVLFIKQDFGFYDSAFSFIWEKIGNTEFISTELLHSRNTILDLLVAGSFTNAKLVFNSSSAAQKKRFLTKFIMYESKVTENYDSDYSDFYSDICLCRGHSGENSIVETLKDQPELKICQKFINSEFGLQYFVELKKIKTKFNDSDEGSSSCSTKNSSDSLRLTSIKLLNRQTERERKKLVSNLIDLALFEKFSAFLIDFLCRN